MDRVALSKKISWHVGVRWHLRRQPASHELSVQDTVKGLQALLLADQGAMLRHTLHQVFASPVDGSELAHLDITLAQEGADQRVWHAMATRTNDTQRPFGIITARAPAASSTLTESGFHILRQLHARQPRYCAQPFVCGRMPVASGVAAYTVEWLAAYRELVFEIAHAGGVFLVNAPDAHRLFSPEASRRIWRRLLEILWWYAGLRHVNIQAGDFVGREQDDGRIDLKLTTARAFQPTPEPAAHLHTLLRSVITASGYLSDGRRPFDRHLSKSAFLHRMQAVLRRRFGDRAVSLAKRQWQWFQEGRFAQQEDWLKADSILATYDYMQANHPADRAWQETCRCWLAYADAVQAGRYPPSWWFPAMDIPMMLERLAQQLPTETPPCRAGEGAHDELRKNHSGHE